MYVITTGKTKDQEGIFKGIERTVINLDASLEWTSDPPTQEGWYWVDGYFRIGPGVVFVEKLSNGRFEIQFGDLVDYVDEFPQYKWLGPLPVPEIPKG